MYVKSSSCQDKTQGRLAASKYGVKMQTVWAMWSTFVCSEAECMRAKSENDIDDYLFFDVIFIY